LPGYECNKKSIQEAEIKKSTLKIAKFMSKNNPGIKMQNTGSLQFNTQSVNTGVIGKAQALWAIFHQSIISI